MSDEEGGGGGDGGAVVLAFIFAALCIIGLFPRFMAALFIIVGTPVVVGLVAYVLYRIISGIFSFMEWWESREIVQYRIAKRKITRRTNQAIAKLERGS
jgi:UDP-N-acetylmuramyl pentapeptide phosphotransferase/UDP-N-acetylglucosamine-1-phosphate transferase